ncbi:HlyC/CorC family transporter [Ferrovibrio xuzhouensis]|uniref:HlyC/CorC family transporter n=1 Tax=Ferrovibrio xuzhouensis TaxID=1576914 RepID=A0ABV7VEX0_9PROT
MSETEIIVYGVAIIVLLVLSAFFSMSETGLTAASPPRIHHLEGQGKQRATVVLRLLERRDLLLSSILLGNNLVNILASALATNLLIALFGSAGVVYATIAMTVLVLVFGEVMPKTYAINKPERVALGVAPVIDVIVRVTAPVLHAVQWFGSRVLRLFGVHITREQVLSASEEFRSTLQLHAEEGTMVKHERDMLGSILDLEEVPVGDIMVHRRNMVMLDADLPPHEIVQQVLASPHTRIPVWRGEPENVIGVLHAKDLLRALSAVQFEVARIDLARLVSPPWFVPETTTLRGQLNAFRQRRAHFALVVDEYGAIMGLVTLEDILEEIVGDIRDEHDPASRLYRRQADGALVVDGMATIRDLNRQFDWHLPDDDATTIAGLVLHEAQMIPDPGQIFVFHGFRFEILRRHRHQITLLKLTPIPEGEPASSQS